MSWTSGASAPPLPADWARWRPSKLARCSKKETHWARFCRRARSVIAQFPPPAAFGRIRPGQPARLRLEGFPWAQYGTVTATVSRVAGEVRDGRVRVELLVNPQSASRIPLQHGMPGSVEVQVENVSPAALALRAAGQMIGEPTSVFRTQTP